MLSRLHKRLIALNLVLLAVILLFLIFDRTPALPPVMVLPPGPLAVKSGRVPDRWIPAKWTWLHRACRFVFGPPKQVGYYFKFIETSESVASIVSQNSLGPPLAESNGVAIWILPGKELPATTILFGPVGDVLRTDRTEANVPAGSDMADLFTRLEKETADLSARLIFTSDGQTNFVAAVRAQLPYGHALFVLDVRQPRATKRYEFLITRMNTTPTETRFTERRARRQTEN